MEFFNKLAAPITSDKLEAKGQNLYKLGKVFMFAGACGLGLLSLIAIIVVVAYSPYTLFNYVLLLNTRSGVQIIDFLVNVLVFIAYIGTLMGIVGIPMYTIGLNTFALGRIAHNTEKK